VSLLRKCRECKEPKSLSEFSLDRGQSRRLCKKCASNAQSVRYRGQGAAGRARILKNWNAHFQRDPARARFTLAKSAAKQKGFCWLLTIEEYRTINSLPCWYCGEGLPPKGIGLDRKDNSAGYFLENVLPCCNNCNRLRGDRLTVEETRVAVQAIQLYRQNVVL
jgi:hypothetical protein